MIAATLHFAAKILAWRHSTMSALLHITGTVPDQSKALMSKTIAMVSHYVKEHVLIFKFGPCVTFKWREDNVLE